MAVDDVALGHVVDTPERIQDLDARTTWPWSRCQEESRRPWRVMTSMRASSSSGENGIVMMSSTL
jgi:hypothetical protein